MNYVKSVALYKAFFGILAIILGYCIGKVTQSATMIVLSYLICVLPCGIFYHVKFFTLLKTEEQRTAGSSEKATI